MRCYRKILHIYVQRPCYQRGSPCQDPASNRTTRRPPDHCKQTRTEVVWTCLSFVRSGQIHFCKTEGKEEERLRNFVTSHHHHQSLNREGRWGTTDDFATSFLHFSLFSTVLWDLPNSRPVHSPDVVFPPLPLSASSSSPFHRASQDGFGRT